MSELQSGKFQPDLSRTVYAWPADGDMPEGFKPLTQQRQDEAVLYGDDDQPFYNPDGDTIYVKRGQAVVTDCAGCVLQTVDLDDEDAVNDFLSRHGEDGSANGVDALAVDSNEDAQPEKSEETPDAVVPSSRPEGLSDTEWQMITDSRKVTSGNATEVNQ